MVSSLQAFNLNELGTIKEEKILTITLYEGYLITGDDKGIICLYESNIEKKKIEQNRNFCTKDRKPIEQLVCSPCSNILYVLSRGIVYILTIPKMEQILSQPKDSVLKIAVNQHPDYQNNLLLITKKKKIKIVSIDFGEKKFVEETNKKEKKDFALEIDPEIYEWYGELFCYAHGSKAIWVNVRTGETSAHSLDKIQNIKFIQDGWLVLSEGVGLFLNTSGVMQISPVSFDPSPMINYFGYKNYIIALHNHTTEIMAITPNGDSSQVQTIDLEDDKCAAKYFLKSQNRMIIVALTPQNGFKLWLLDEVSFETQIGLLLDSNKIDEAMNKLNDNVLSLDDRKPDRMEQFFIDCAWAQIKHENYETAYKYAHLTRFNPFEFMYLYYSLLDIKTIHPSDSMKQIQNCNFLSDKMKKNDETMKRIYRLIINLLNKKRDFILRTYDLSKELTLKQEMEFVTSKKAIIDLSKTPMKLTVQQVFYHVNINLLKAMIKNQDENPKKIAEIIEHSAFTTICPDDSSYDFADEIYGKKESKVFVDQREIQVARAYLYEKNKLYSEALDIWEKKFGHANNKTYLSEAREKTKRILLTLSESKTDRENNKKLLLKYIQWLLLDDGGSVNAFEIITSSDLFSYDYFILDLIPKVEGEYAYQISAKKKTEDSESSSTFPNKSDPSLNLKVKFLEYLNQYFPSEKYQTLLLETYIEEVLKRIPVKDPNKEMSENEKKQFFDQKKKFFEESKVYKSLLDCLYQENACYNKMLILDKVKNKLIEVEMFLSSALNFHRAALDRLLKEDVDDERKIFAQIEKFCSENVKKKPDLYSDLFNILAEQYKTLTRSILETKKNLETIESKPSKSPEEIKSVIDMKDLLKKSEKRLETIKEEMLKVMISFGDFEKLDPVFVLSKIPDDWNAIEDKLKLYISTVMKNYSHLVNKYKNGKCLSEMALLYKEREALQVKNKSVTIENDTNCEFCGKKIGNTIFVVYPNMKVYHSKCATNSSICPTTGVDFTKKKLVN